jgi:hypothetical protein
LIAAASTTASHQLTVGQRSSALCGPPPGSRPRQAVGRRLARSLLARITFVSTLYWQPPAGCTQVSGWNLNRDPILTWPELGPDSDQATPKIPATQLHTSSTPQHTSQHSPFPHTSVHRQWRPQRLVGIRLQPCGAASDLPAALARPPPPPPESNLRRSAGD